MAAYSWKTWFYDRNYLISGICRSWKMCVKFFNGFSQNYSLIKNLNWYHIPREENPEKTFFVVVGGGGVKKHFYDFGTKWRKPHVRTNKKIKRFNLLLWCTACGCLRSILNLKFPYQLIYLNFYERESYFVLLFYSIAWNFSIF